ncbi:hypothetical protein [Mangrovimonas futianensis]|uniref:hypothetical protein n=1 Tax=Mangrovimonas futianensis TaxID=2895523 RepID=UPI001E40FA9C|nr:hypothetical protein [Mangrovimonas futianensis]MCF1420845.1 hypothetical protein [Mangrovimonas futianensis]
MIDFVRINYRDKSEFEPYIDNPDNFREVFKVLESNTGEVLYPYRTRLDKMDIVVTEKGGYVKNSLHKLYNYIHSREDKNHNDFEYSKLCETILHVSRIPDLTHTSLTNLEFGLNIRVDRPAEEILKKSVLMHNYKGYNHNRKFNGKGELKQFDHSNYVIKVYDKAKQYKLEYNVFRFEVKFTRRRDFNKVGVYNLDDLKSKDNLKELFKIYLMRFDEMLILDEISEDSIEQLDYQKLLKFVNPKYWEEDIKTMSGTTRMRHRNQFNVIIEKYGLDSTKKELRRLLVEKFDYLINH